jgi:hypothetical protein
LLLFINFTKFKLFSILLLFEDISADSSENDLKNYLQSLRAFGSVEAIRSKDCSGFKWRIKWNDGGRKTPFAVDSSLIGNQPAISTRVLQVGGAMFAPLPGDMIRTQHSKAQVSR